MRNRLLSIICIGGMLVLLAAAMVWLIAILSGDAGGAREDGPPIAGCVEVKTQELYVQHAYDCPDGVRVVTFADDDARDTYLTIAEKFGVKVVERGPAWARTRA